MEVYIYILTIIGDLDHEIKKHSTEKKYIDEDSV